MLRKFCWNRDPGEALMRPRTPSAHTCSLIVKAVYLMLAGLQGARKRGRQPQVDGIVGEMPEALRQQGIQRGRD
jgi:hypothetical protein